MLYKKDIQIKKIKHPKLHPNRFPFPADASDAGDASHKFRLIPVWDEQTFGQSWRRDRSPPPGEIIFHGGNLTSLLFKWRK